MADPVPGSGDQNDPGNSGDKGGDKTKIIPPGSGDATSFTDVASLTKILSDDNLKVVASKGLDKSTDIKAFLNGTLDQFRNVETQVGKNISFPKVDASEEDFNKFVEGIRPKDVSAYKFDIPKDVPKEMPYDSEFAKGFQQTAHDLGLHPIQARKLHDWYVGNMAKAFTESSQQLATEVTSSHQSLTKDWGAEDTPMYKENVEFARRAIMGLGGVTLAAELARLGAVDSEGNVRSAPIAKMLATVGAALMKEDSMIPSPAGGGVPGENPFAKGTENTQKQGAIIRQNPDEARRLMRQAGIDPKEYQM